MNPQGCGPIFASRGSRLHICILTSSFLLAGMFASAAAQVDPSAPASSLAVNSPISQEDIETLRKQASAAAELDDETKTKIEAALSLAANAIKRVGELGQQSEQDRTAAETVQQRKSNLETRLQALAKEDIQAPKDALLSELEQEILAIQVDLATWKKHLSEAEASMAKRAGRRREIRQALLSRQQRMSDLEAQWSAEAPANEPVLLTAARRAELRARRQLLEAEQPALQNELAKYDAEEAANFTALERDVFTAEIRARTSRLALFEAQLARQRAADTAEAIRQATEEAAQYPSALRAEAKRNVALTETVHELNQEIQKQRSLLDETKAALESLQKRFATTKQRTDDIGLTGSVGAMLRRQRTQLPNVAEIRRLSAERRTLIEKTQDSFLQLDDERAESQEDAVARITRKLAGAGSGETVPSQDVETLVQRRRNYLDKAIQNHNTLLDTLFELDATSQVLVRETSAFATYMQQRVLWIRSNRLLFRTRTIDDSAYWLLDLANWDRLVSLVMADVSRAPVLYGLAAVLLLYLLWKKRRLQLRVESLGRLAENPGCRRFSVTAETAAITVILSAIWPAMITFIAWRLNEDPLATQFSLAIAHVMFVVACVYAPIEFLRRMCRRYGLANSHFNWSESAIRMIRWHVRWAAFPAMAAIATTSYLTDASGEDQHDMLERISFILAAALFTFIVTRIVHPTRGLPRTWLLARQGGWIDHLKHVWYAAFLAIPIALIVMTIAGYYYTALQISWRLYMSLTFLLAAHVTRDLLMRWVLVRRRSLALEASQAQRAMQAQNEGNQPKESAELLTGLGDGGLPVATIDPKAELSANTEQIRRLVRVGFLFASVVLLWAIWVDVLPAIGILDQWTLWKTKVPATTQESSLPLGMPSAADGSTPANPASIEVIRDVTVADLGLAILIAIATIACARNIPGLMEFALLNRLPLDNSIRYAITSITSYAITLVGIVFSFGAISVGWTQVQWLATALTFGLAFGLQEIFANFVAGLILLFERPIRVGDVVTVDDVTGVVSRIRIRATTITNWDRKEYVIPNREFITGRVLNWTLSDKTNRLLINVGIAYGSDVAKAKRLLLDVCVQHPVTLSDPPTVVTFEGFGDSTLNLVVRTYLPNLENRLQVIDDLHSTIDQVFREEGIEIAFPQRDLHLRSVDGDLVEGFRRASGTERDESQEIPEA